MIKIQLSAKFDIYGHSFLLPEESTLTYDLRTSLSLIELFFSIRDDVGIEYDFQFMEFVLPLPLHSSIYRFSEELLTRLQKNPETLGTRPFEFKPSDIKGFTVRTRHLLESFIKLQSQKIMSSIHSNPSEFQAVLASHGVSHDELIDKIFGSDTLAVLSSSSDFQ